MAIKMNNDRRWLDRMAEAEDYGVVTAGGLLARAAAEDQDQESIASERKVLGRLVELARRHKGLSVQELAERAGIALVEAVAIETNSASGPSPRTLYGLAKALDLPATGIMELAGLARRRDSGLAAAAVRFAAKAEPIAKLSREERDALDEFVRALAGLADRK